MKNKNLKVLIILAVCVSVLLTGMAASDFYSVTVHKVNDFTNGYLISCMDTGNILLVTGYKLSGLTESFSKLGKNGAVDCENTILHASVDDRFIKFTFDIDGNVMAVIDEPEFKNVDNPEAKFHIYLPVIIK